MAQISAQTPQHIAIIMDGNRRWARANGLNPVEGHRRVVDDVLEPLVDRCIELNVPYLTLWAFSTENWDRDRFELQAIMQLFRYGLSKKTEMLFQKGVRIKVLGELSRFPKDVADICYQWMEKTKDNTKITVTFALNYGGRDEITRAVNRVIQEKQANGEMLSNSVVTQSDIEQHLDTAGYPDPDLIIRPGGQLRLSGFMPWQSVYAELYFSDTLMPDFTPEKLDEALAEFASRQRRFGR